MADAILTFRSAAQSQRFDRAWNLVASAYRTDVTPVDNVFPFQKGSPDARQSRTYTLRDSTGSAPSRQS